jgi:hypothetical protein
VNGTLVCDVERLKLRIWATAMACGIVLALCGNAARSDTDECRDALDHYNSARSDVSSALRQYGRCVSDSKGHDDCASEFSTLHSAQDDFESAVS